MSSLHQRREKAELSFFFKAIHGFIDCPGLLAQISLRVPQTATRALMPFYVPVASSVHNPVFRMEKIYNGLASHLDIFCRRKDIFF